MAAAQQGSGFTNLNRIISENSGNQLGNTVQSGVQNDVNSLNSNVQQSQTAFNQGAQAANNDTSANQQYVSGLLGGITGAGTPAPPTASTIAPAGAQTAPLGAFAPPGSAAVSKGNGSLTSFAPSSLSGPSPTAATSGPSALGSATPSTFNTPSAPAASTTTPAAPASSTPAAPVKSTQDLSNNPGSFGLSQAGSGATATDMSVLGSAAPTQGDITKFGQYLQGGYSGPQQLNNYQGLIGQAQNLQNVGRNVQSQGGLQSLLQQYVGGSGGGYNRGEQSLDTLLLGQTGGPQLQNIAKTTQNIGQVPQNAEAQAEALAATTGTQNNAFAQNVLGQLASSENPLLQNIQGNLGTINSQNTAYQNQGQAIYNLLNNINTAPTAAGTSATAAPAAVPAATQQANAIAALTQAQQNGMITAGQLNDLTAMLPNITANGSDIESALKGMFTYNPQSALPQYTLQQGATGQQAAQLNALQQLGQDTSGQFNTYGGLALPNYGFDLSKAPSFGTLTAAQQAAGAQGTTRNGLSDIANTAYGDVLSPTAGLIAAGGSTLNSMGTAANQAGKGDIGGAAGTYLATPFNSVSNGARAINGSIGSAGSSINDLASNYGGQIGSTIGSLGGPLGAKAGNYIGTNFGSDIGSGIQAYDNGIQTPLNMINSIASGVGNGISTAGEDLGKGNVGGALSGLAGGIGNAASGALTGLENGINSIGGGQNSVVNTIGHAITGGHNSVINQGARAVMGQRFFCTELYKRKLANISEIFEMSKFLLSSVFKNTKMVYFYATNGQAIVDAANANNFNWSSVKYKLIDEVIGLMNDGKNKESQIAYSLMIKKLCLSFKETECLWNDSLMTTSWLEMITLLPKVIKTGTFKMACRLYISSKIYSLKKNTLLWQAR